MSIFLSIQAFAQEVVKIPTDSKATYTYLEVTGTAAKPILLSKREGPSGVSYSKRVFDCNAKTAKYLGDGETMEEMRNSKPDAKMGPIVDQSITWYHYKKVCKK